MACGHVDISSRRLHIHHVERGTGRCNDFSEIAKTIGSWMKEGDPGPVLLAVDAPLGWPIRLKQALLDHNAGEPLVRDRCTPDHDSEKSRPNLGNYLFRRHTDRFIKCIGLGASLDVGANMIARVARSALELLSRIRCDGRMIPLAWKPEDLNGNSVRAIEGYPRLTVRQLLGNKCQGYKTSKEDGKKKRKRIVDKLCDDYDFHEKTMRKPENPSDYDDDLIDAVLCVVEGRHFLCGKSIGPDSGLFKKWLRSQQSPSFVNADDIARKEGWIWFHKELCNR